MNYSRVLIFAILMIVMSALSATLVSFVFVKWSDIGSYLHVFIQNLLEFFILLALFVVNAKRQYEKPYAHASVIAAIFWLFSATIGYLMLLKAELEFQPLTLLIPFLLLVIAASVGTTVGLKLQVPHVGKSY